MSKNLKQYEADAKTWATAHVVMAVLIAAAVGLMIGALAF